MNAILETIFYNPKTTVTAAVGAVVFLLAKFGLQVPTDVQIGIVAVTVWVIGLFSKDGDE